MEFDTCRRPWRTATTRAAHGTISFPSFTAVLTRIADDRASWSVITHTIPAMPDFADVADMRMGGAGMVAAPRACRHLTAAVVAVPTELQAVSALPTMVDRALG